MNGVTEKLFMCQMFMCLFWPLVNSLPFEGEMSRKSKVRVFSGANLMTCILPTFFPPTTWAISFEFCGKPFLLEANDFLGACCRKAMTSKKLRSYFFGRMT